MVNFKFVFFFETLPLPSLSPSTQFNCFVPNKAVACFVASLERFACKGGFHKCFCTYIEKMRTNTKLRSKNDACPTLLLDYDRRRPKVLRGDWWWLGQLPKRVCSSQCAELGVRGKEGKGLNRRRKGQAEGLRTKDNFNYNARRNKIQSLG